METASQQTVKKPKKPPRETCGTCECPFCRTEQPVRKNINDKFYINCTTCGVVQPALPYFQEWILEHARLYGADGPGKRPPAVPAKSPEPDTRDEPRIEPAPVELPAAAQTAPPAAMKAKTVEKKTGFGMFRRD